MRRGLACVAGLVLIAGGCRDGGDDVTWDLSKPVLGTDLGAVSPQLVEVDGPDPITVRFPSGRVVEFEGFLRAQVAFVGNSSSDSFLDQVRVRSFASNSVEELAEEVATFTAEWGGATDDDGVTLDDFVDTVDPDRAPRDTREFVGVEQDGIVPQFDVRMGSDDEGSRFVVTGLFDFEP